MSTQFFSVIIPNYNRTTKLQRAIKSVLHQSYQNFEIIIVDDASTINPMSSLEIFTDQRIHLIQLKNNKGAANARNMGTVKAKGDYIAFLDSDDEWFADYLESRLEILNQENIDGCYGAVIKLRENVIIGKPPVRLPTEKETMASYIISGTLRASTPSLIMKREAFLDIKFDNTLIIHEDYDMVIRFSQKYRWSCDTIPRVKVHLSDTGLSAHFDFTSSLIFLNRYAKDIDFKWLLFYCLRKITIAYKKEQQKYIPVYIEILNKNLSKASFFYKFNFFVFKNMKRLYLLFFETAVYFAYKIGIR